MGLNDHLFKYWFPGFLTGKISDFAGIFYFPLMLAALFILLKLARGKVGRLTAALLLVCIGLTDLLFVAVKMSELINHFVVTNFSAYFFPIKIMMDGTDLVALLMNIPTYFFGRRYFATTAA